MAMAQDFIHNACSGLQTPPTTQDRRGGRIVTTTTRFALCSFQKYDGPTLDTRGADVESTNSGGGVSRPLALYGQRGEIQYIRYDATLT